MPRINRTSSVVADAEYPNIIAEYNKILKEKGRVNNLSFYREFVQPRTNITKSAWYRFITRFSGVTPIIASPTPFSVVNPPPAAISEAEVIQNLLASPIAIQRGVALALNIGEKALRDLFSEKSSLPPEKKIDLLFKAMKAQDSRINAIARMKKDQREEVAFEEVFGRAAYESDDLE